MRREHYPILWRDKLRPGQVRCLAQGQEIVVLSSSLSLPAPNSIFIALSLTFAGLRCLSDVSLWAYLLKPEPLVWCFWEDLSFPHLGECEGKIQVRVENRVVQRVSTAEHLGAQGGQPHGSDPGAPSLKPFVPVSTAAPTVTSSNARLACAAPWGPSSTVWPRRLASVFKTRWKSSWSKGTQASMHPEDTHLVPRMGPLMSGAGA